MESDGSWNKEAFAQLLRSSLISLRSSLWSRWETIAHIAARRSRKERDLFALK